MHTKIQNGLNTWQKLLIVQIVILIHSFVWAFVNNYNSHYSTDQLNQLSSVIDQYIPYIGWSWFIYYSTHFYIVLGTTFSIWNFSRIDFFKITILFCLMSIIGGIIQLIIPAKSPLPEQMNLIHAWIHRNFMHDPFVCFPSMHVSLAALTSLLIAEKLKLSHNRIIVSIVLILICISTLTIKEHYFIDVPAGLLLGYLFFRLFHFHLSKEKGNDTKYIIWRSQ